MCKRNDPRGSTLVALINGNQHIRIMLEYIEDGDVKVTYLRLFKRHYRKYATAQLNIHPDDVSKIQDANCWPPGVFIKQWKSQAEFDKYIEAKQADKDTLYNRRDQDKVYEAEDGGYEHQYYN